MPSSANKKAMTEERAAQPGTKRSAMRKVPASTTLSTPAGRSQPVAMPFHRPLSEAASSETHFPFTQTIDEMIEQERRAAGEYSPKLVGCREK